MIRKRIWEIDCTLLDAALLLSFDAGELENTCRATDVLVTPHAHRPEAYSLVDAIHRACHEPTPTAHLVERQLDMMHGPRLRELDREGLESVSHRLLTEPLGQQPDLAAALWWLARHPHTAAADLIPHVHVTLGFSALLALGAQTGAPPPTPIVVQRG